MQEVTRKRAIGLGLRAKVPVITRIVAFTLLVSGLTVVGISYYKLRNNEKFRAKSEKPELSKEVKGVVEGYERRVTKNDRLWLLVKASRDITFSDDHHELENVNMAVYPPKVKLRIRSLLHELFTNLLQRSFHSSATSKSKPKKN